jgi:putative methionine-R-sulfoxide reductase with GAF domain
MGMSNTEPEGHSMNTTSVDTHRKYIALRLSGTMTAVLVMSTFFFTGLAIQLKAWQVYTFAGLSGTFLIIAAYSLVSMWRGRVSQGTWLLIGGVWLAAPLAAGLVDGLGLTLGIGAALLTAQIAGQILPSKLASRTIIVGAGVGTVTFLVDSLDITTQLSISPIQLFIPIAVIFLVLVYGYSFLRQFQNYSLRTKLIIIFIGISMLSVSAVGNILSLIIENTVTEQTTNNLTLQVEKLSDFIGAVFIEKMSQVKGMAVTDAILEELAERNAQYSGDEATISTTILELDAQWTAAPDDDPFIQSIISAEEGVNVVAFQLYDYLEAFPDHAEIFVTDRYGATVGATGRLSDYYQADEEWWQAAWNNGEGAVYISDPQFDESAGVTAVLVAMPLVDENNDEILGIIRSTLTLDDIFEVVRDQRFGETGRAILVDRNGDVLFEEVPEGQEGSTQDLSPEIREMFTRDEIQSMVETDEHSDLSVFAHALAHVEGFGTHEEEAEEEEEVSQFRADVAQAVANLGWGVVLRQEASEAFATIGIISRTIQLVTLVVVGIAAALAAYFATTLIRPLEALGAAASAIAAGNLAVPLPEASEDEIGRLTTEFANMSNQLQKTIGELQQRTLVIETSSEVSRYLSTILDEQELMSSVVNQVQRGFNYYHAHIYLLDERENKLIMTAGTGQPAQEMLAQRHRIRMGEGLVGQAAQTQKGILVSDVRQDPNWLPNSLLPETKSEIAVPITVGGQVLGVLDVQHNIVNGLQAQDADLLELLANQIGIALQNARLFTQTQQQANQQALINEIGRKIQTAPTVERVLQIAAEELGEALGTQRTTVQLNSRSQTNGRSQ